MIMRNTTFILLHGSLAALSLMFGVGLAVFGMIYSDVHSFGQAMIFLMPLLTGGSGAISILWRQSSHHKAWVQLVVLASSTGVSMCFFWMMIFITESLLLSILFSVMCGAFWAMLALCTAPIKQPVEEDNGIFWG